MWLSRFWYGTFPLKCLPTQRKKMDLKLSQIIAISLAGNFSDGRNFSFVFYGCCIFFGWRCWGNGWECFHTIIVKLRVWPPPVYIYAGENSFRHFRERKGRLLYALYSTLPPLYMVKGGRTREKKENIEGGSNTAFEHWIEHDTSPEAVSVIKIASG